MRFNLDMDLPGMDSDTWYRVTDDNAMVSMLGETMALAADPQPMREMSDLFSEVGDSGTVTFEGRALTRLVGAVDSGKFAEKSLEIAKRMGGGALDVGDAGLRQQLRAMAPASMEYGIDTRAASSSRSRVTSRRSTATSARS